ncbi:EF-Hand 1, calcium-binding site protein [Actinidia chinensis var. chinensis]|uniref:EF-Hand 1, calcium-binding site protein n=1 Tax=Actinidia chinensis var. chinensis TaxID=1590841 RepID=A0A2R6PQV1_ACTCC|nr:EF-Hand 1, calcium-binding site protein [Actinidia chinensis var. chinensis]
MGESNRDFYNQEQQAPSSSSLGSVSCTTFNILAPIYKRLNGQNVESEFRELWVSRNESILDRLLDLSSSIICLQEFWVGNEELVRMYEKRLGDAGYQTYKLPRTNNRGDGLLAAVLQNDFHVVNYRELLLNDIGDRVAQLLHAELVVHSSHNQHSDMEKQVLVVNTHLIFPHDSSYCFVRLRQVYKILQYVDKYCQENQLPHVPVILCGDWNGSKKGNVCKFLQSQGFVSSYDITHPYTYDGEDFSKWISHRNHRGNVCGVDFIWLRNPSIYRKPLKESFMEAVLGNIHNISVELSTEATAPLPFLEPGGSHITYSQFSKALSELGIIGHPQDCLGTEDMKDLWEHIDTDGDGVIDLSDFAGAWNSCGFVQQNEDSEENRARTKDIPNTLNTANTIRFNVSKAMLFPPEVERGAWPDDYSLSDHAQLTVVFSAGTMHYS